MTHSVVNAWTAADARGAYSPARDDDHKYSRGVVALVTGSARFPGAGVLGVDAASRVGCGMVRYLGSPTVRSAVLARRPEAVFVPGRTDAWVVGSGVDPSADGGEDPDGLRLRAEQALGGGDAVVVDAGALALVPAVRRTGTDAGGGGGVLGISAEARPWILTPHLGEFRTLARRVGVPGAEASGWPGEGDDARAAAAAAVAGVTGAVLLLKGATTLVARPDGNVVAVHAATPWLATAGTGDVLAGAIGALAAIATARAGHHPPTHAQLQAIAATGAWLHGRAGVLASSGGPLTALDVAEALPAAVRELLG